MRDAFYADKYQSAREEASGYPTGEIKEKLADYEPLLTPEDEETFWTNASMTWVRALRDELAERLSRESIHTTTDYDS